MGALLRADEPFKTFAREVRTVFGAAGLRTIAAYSDARASPKKP